MMKKWQSIRAKMLVLLGGAALAATLGSCADGYDSPDGFDAGVKNTTMVTPNQIFIYLNQAGTEATIQWEMVKGCSGHEVTLLNTDDPENPVVVDGYDKRIVDGSRMTVPVQEDSHYKITMRTLGNKDLGNKDAENTLEKEFVTGVPSLGTIAGGTEEAPVNLNEWWTANQPENTKGEWAFELEAGKYYEITDTLDLSIHWLTFRGNKNDRPIIFMKGKGTITSCSAKSGGAVFLNNSDFYMFGGSIENNTATNQGGALAFGNWNNPAPTVYMSGGSMEGTLPAMTR